MSALWRRLDANDRYERKRAVFDMGACLRRTLTVFCLFIASAISCVAEAQSAFTTSYRWDAMRRVVAEISPSSNGTTAPFFATRYTYDADGQLIKTETGSLSTWQAEGVAPANWPSNDFAVFQTKIISYDFFGHKIEERVLAYNSQTQINELQAVTQLSYDDADRLICSAVRMNLSAVPTAGGNAACALGTQGAGANDFGPDRIAKSEYDAAGQLLQVRKAVGTPLEQAHVTYGWKNPATGQIEPGYTRNGKQEYVVDANGNKAKYEYDGFGRLQKWIFPSKTRPNGFNSAASPANVLLTAGALNTDDYELYGYDKNSNRTSLRKRDNQIIGYSYDALNRVTYKGGATTAAVDFAYDLTGFQLGATFNANGQGIAGTYDNLGRLRTSTTTMGGVSRTLTYEYDGDGNRTKLTFPDGQYIMFEYDGLNRMKAIKENGTTQIATLNYDNQGRRSSLVGGVSTNYGYDAVGRMSSIAHNLGQNISDTAYDVTYCMGALSGTCAPSYNPASQILKRTVSNDSYVWNGAYQVNRNYTTNGLNQYTVAGTRPFSYDANGNLTNDGGTAYAYDSENRLLSASGSTNATLSYDPNGRLFQTTGSATTQFLYDGDALVGEYDGSSNLLRRYVHGPATDEPLFWYEGTGLATRRILRDDHQGSIVAVAHANGDKFAINSYDEYGIPASTNEGRFAYTGQIYLPDLKFYHYKARIYSPTLGRFLQTDPIGYKDQTNLYAYVGNDPMNARDPTGEQIGGTYNEYHYCYSAPDPAACISEHNSGKMEVFGAVAEIAAAAIDVLDTPVSPGPDTTIIVTGARKAAGGKSIWEKIGQWMFGKKKPSDLDRARAARDELAAELKPLGRKAPATVVGGANKRTGQVVACASGNKKCAEDHVVEALGGNKDEVVFTEAVCPRLFKEPNQGVAVCERCEANYGRDSFPEGTKFQSDDK